MKVIHMNEVTHMKFNGKQHITKEKLKIRLKNLSKDNLSNSEEIENELVRLIHEKTGKSREEILREINNPDE